MIFSLASRAFSYHEYIYMLNKIFISYNQKNIIEVRTLNRIKKVAMLTRDTSIDTTRSNGSLDDASSGTGFLSKPDLSFKEDDKSDNSPYVPQTKTQYVKWNKGNYKARQKDIPADTKPLHTATMSGSPSTIKSLLVKGADPDQQDEMGKVALHIASKALDVKIMKLLLEHGADVNKLDMFKMNALHYVLLSGKRNRSNAVVQCMELLISHKVDVNAVEVTGQTALHFAAIRSEEKWVEVLIKNGAFFSGGQTDEASSLYIAIKNCDKSVINCLDTCITGPDGKLNEETLSMKKASSKVSEVMLNYEHLQGYHQEGQDGKTDPTTFFMSILDLKKNNDDPNFHNSVKKIFMHPSTQAYVFFSWSNAKWLYYSLVLFSHLIYSLIYSFYAVMIYKYMCSPEAKPVESFRKFMDILSTETTCTMESAHEPFPNSSYIAVICWLLLIPFTCVFIVSELTKVGQKISNLKTPNFSTCLCALWEYCTNLESLLSWLLIYSFCVISFHQNPFAILTGSKTFKVARYQYHASAYGVFITWFLLMLMIGRATDLGLYVGMLKKVTLTIAKVLFAYVSLIIGFVLSFFILLDEQHTFAKSISTMMIKVRRKKIINDDLVQLKFENMLSLIQKRLNIYSRF